MPRWKSKSGKNHAKQVDNARRAFEMRLAGRSLQAVADELGLCNPGAAHKLVMRAMQDIPKELGEQVREMELGRLDKILERAEALWSAEGATMTIKDAALATMLKVQERRARLLGIDAATKFEMGGGMTLATASLDKILESYVSRGLPRSQWPSALLEYESQRALVPAPVVVTAVTAAVAPGVGPVIK